MGLLMPVSVVSVPVGRRCSSSLRGVAGVQRARLLSAALRVVFEEGYSGLSVARVTGVARVSRRTFYEAFEDREDCFLAIFEDALERVGERVAGAYARGGASGGDGWCGGVRGALTELLGFLEDDPRLARVLVVDALGAGPRVLARRAEVLEMVGRELQRDGARAVAGGGRGEGRGSSALSLDTVLPALNGEGVVGGVFGVLHTQLSQARAQDCDGGGEGSLLGLRNSLMAMIVLPYGGLAAARRELVRPLPRRSAVVVNVPGDVAPRGAADPLAGLPMRVTYRTLRVLGAIAQRPGVSNRVVGELAGVPDQGQISKLLARLERLGLVENRHGGRGAHGRGGGSRRVAGEANAWCLTARGVGVERALRVQGNSGNVNGGSVR